MPPKSRARGQQGGRQAPSDVLPSWPPLSSKYDLRLCALLPSQVYTVSNLFTQDECRRFITAVLDTQTCHHTLRFETTPSVPKPGDALRYNDRIAFFDPELASTLWNAVGLRGVCERSAIGFDAAGDVRGRPQSSKRCWGLNPNFRLYRYTPGMRFEKHYDDSVKVYTDVGVPSSATQPMTDNNDGDRGARSRATVKDMLTEDGSFSPFDDNTDARKHIAPTVLVTEFTVLVYLTGEGGSGSEVGHQDKKRKAIPPRDRSGAVQPIPGVHEPLTGGQTAFYDADVASSRPKRTGKKKAESTTGHAGPNLIANVPPLAGMALLHRHGPHCLLHESKEVTSGVKYVLRTDVLYAS